MCAGAPVKRLGAIVESIAAVLLAVVVVIVLVQVFGRYILRISLSWPEELARYVLVWLTFFGVAAAAASRSQIVVDTILELVSPRVRRVLEGIGALAGLVAVGLLVWTSQPLLFGPAGGSTSPATGIPSFWIYLAVPVGGVLLGAVRPGRSRAASFEGSPPRPLPRRPAPIRLPRPAPAFPDRSWRASFPLLGVVFLVLIFAGIPVAYSMILTAAAHFYVLSPGISATVIAQRPVGLISESFTLLAVPLFLLAGNLLNACGMTARLVAFSVALVGHVRGGLGHAVVVANVIMAGMSGSATADAAGIGSIMIPSLIRAGFSPRAAAALTASAATLGPIIPPSVAMVLYASLSNVSLGRLLLAGFLPGFVIALFLMVDLWLSPESRRVARLPFDWRHLLLTARDADPRPDHARHHPGRHVRRGLHADRGRGGGGRLRPADRGRRLPVPHRRHHLPVAPGVGADDGRGPLRGGDGQRGLLDPHRRAGRRGAPAGLPAVPGLAADHACSSSRR